MTRSVKLPRKTVSLGQGKEGKRIQRESDLLRENLKRRKQQARDKAQSEGSSRAGIAND